MNNSDQQTIWTQKTIRLKAQPRGFHLVTREVLSGFNEIKSVKAGLLNVFIQHTSASISIGENADSTAPHSIPKMRHR